LGIPAKAYKFPVLMGKQRPKKHVPTWEKMGCAKRLGDNHRFARLFWEQVVERIRVRNFMMKLKLLIVALALLIPAKVSADQDFLNNPANT